MTSRRVDGKQESKPRRRAITPEARENQLTALAVDLAERQLREGNASSQVITHYLKVASSRERLEREKLELENQLAQAKIEALASAKRVEALYEGAINAMRAYGGHGSPEVSEE